MTRLTGGQMREQKPGGHSRLRLSFGVIGIRLLSVAAGLAYVKAYTGALSTGEVGAFFYLATLSYGLNALIFVPVDFYMQSRVARLAELPVNGILRLVTQVLLIGLVACIAMGLPLIWLGKLHFGDLPALYAVAALLFVCTSLRGVLNNRGNSIFVSATLLLEATSRLLAFVGASALFGASARTLMYSSALALALELAIILVRARKCLPLSHAVEPLDSQTTILRAAAPIAGSAVCNALQLQTYRVAYPLADLGAASGMYGVVSNIGAAAMSACGSIFSQIHVPRLYESQGASIWRFVGFAVLLAGTVLLAATAFAPFLVRLLTKQQYVPYASIVAFGVITEACNMIVGGYTVLLSIEQRTGLLFKFNIVAAVVSISGCLAALALRPGDPFLIGFAVAGSQLLMTVSLLIFAQPHKAENS